MTALLALCSPLDAQSVPGYAAPQLACARFHESVQSDLTLQTAGRTATANSGRESYLVVAAIARPPEPSIQLVAWFDSLRVWRSAGGNRTEPDASGVLGGRYRAQLLPDGSTTTQVVPFVPAEVKEVTDLGGVLDDMFPRLPPRVLQAGEEWRSGDTLAIKRLGDSATCSAIVSSRCRARGATGRRQPDSHLCAHAERSRCPPGIRHAGRSVCP
jgi:hypothetical protein